jgi:hypothetical protein
MTYSGRSLPQVTPFGVSAHFVDQKAAGAATRALQRTLGIPTEAISVAAEPGSVPDQDGGRIGPVDPTVRGHVIVNVSVPDAETADRVRAALVEAGGRLTGDERGSPSVGGYGPTTAHGRVGIIGGEPETSSMAERSFQDALENDERERQERERAS